MIRCLTLVALTTLMAIQSAAAGDKGFKTIFNGKDLSGWDGDTELWSVKDGVIHGETTAEKKANGNTFLIWEGGTTKDFELRLSFRCNATNNSGINTAQRELKMPETNGSFGVINMKSVIRTSFRVSRDSFMTKVVSQVVVDAHVLLERKPFGVKRARKSRRR